MSETIKPLVLAIRMLKAQTVVEQIHDAKVDDRGDDADDAKLHDLRKEFCMVPALGWRRSAAGMTNSASL